MDRKAQPVGETTSDLGRVVLETYGQKLSSRFQMRLIEQARAGQFANLRSRSAQMRDAFEKLAVLLPHRNLPLFIFGERGTGKRKLVGEFFSLQNFLGRIDSKAPGRLKLLRGDHLERGFSHDWLKIFGAEDLVYIEDIESLSLDVQHEMLKLLASPSLAFRLVLGTTVALSLKVNEGTFLQELFAEISDVSVYLPSLIDRAEDLPHLLGEFLEEMASTKSLPPSQILDMLSRADLARNLDDLETLVRCLLAKKSDAAQWELGDFPPAIRALFPQHLFEADGGAAAHQAKRLAVNTMRRALVECGGNTAEAAKRLGMGKMEFVQRMMALGVR
ncbi:MAG TPA: hypothetical protein VM901_09965 [Bdellovibrionota bacterium]|jgi:DNA-binding NtrC family response regulator|nr:hypothetical protein [Bdellovibrionota bacterium]